MTTHHARLVFEHGFSEQDAAEAAVRGYRSHVWVELIDGTRHRVTFLDPTRAAQELDVEARAGRPFLAEVGLILVAEVTLENMTLAANMLAAEGFFAKP